MTDEHQVLLERLTAVLAADPRVRAAWLSGSLGQDAGDAWSDVDIVVLVEEQDRAKPLAAKRGAPWPTAFEEATRRHLKATLSLEI